MKPITDEPGSLKFQGFCQLAFDYVVTINGYQLKGHHKKRVQSVQKSEGFTDELIQGEIQSSINELIEDALIANPFTFGQDFDGEQPVDVSVHNIETGCFELELNEPSYKNCH
ncbi:hypothetical protein [Rouxiella badensis]|uniref:hypothetical protein n=1 Tax=Rouxiella badensis TaxID=1646377 RepID=UPI001D154079|nr:hypothetical protein [Rouxiella badensis]